MDKSLTLTKTADGFRIVTSTSTPTTASDLQMALEYAADYFNVPDAPAEETVSTEEAVTTPEDGLSTEASAPSTTDAENTEATGEAAI